MAKRMRDKWITDDGMDVANLGRGDLIKVAHDGIAVIITPMDSDAWLTWRDSDGVEVSGHAQTITSVVTFA